jgi:hypothetical protein
MTLYSADVLDIAKPVAAAQKKGKKAKAADAPPAPVEEPVVEVKEEKIEKPKRVASEKQLAALAKAQETRKRKREEADSAKAEEERLEQVRLTMAREKEEAAAAKKEAAKLKRKMARDSKKQIATPPATESSVGSLEEEIEAGIRGPVAKKTVASPVPSDGPPAWFKQYVEGVKKEEAKVSKDKKPQRQIRQEANDAAEHQWNDGFTRDRVRNEVDNHMSRMYQMMFSGRRLK